MIFPRTAPVTTTISPRALWLLSITAIVSAVTKTYYFFRDDQLHLDIEIYRAGARAFLENQSLYAQPFEVIGIRLPFIYPPFGAAILSPFAVMSASQAAVAVVIVSSLLTYLCILLVARALIPDQPLVAFTFGTVIWPFALLSEPLTMNAHFGQINVLVMTLCVLDLVPRRRLLPRGILIGLAAAIKLTPLALCLFFLIKRDWRVLCWTAVGALSATGITALFRWTATVEFFTDMIFKMNSTKGAGVGTAYMTNQSIKGMLARWAPTEDAAVQHQGLIDATWLVIVLITIAAASTLIIMMLRRGLEVDAAMVCAGLMLIISPISWSHHWVWLPLFAMVLLHRWWVTPGNPMLLGVCTAATWLFCLQIKPHWFYGDLHGEMFGFTWLQKLILSGYLWLMFFIFISLFVVLRNNKTPRSIAGERGAEALEN